jgi:thiol-disulfide isomerase/thioredoxin
MKTAFMAVCFASLFVAVSCSGDKHAVTLNINNLGNDTVYAKYIPVSEYGSGENLYTDTFVSVNGKLHFDLPVNEDVIIILLPSKLSKKRAAGDKYYTAERSILLFAEPNGRLKVSGRIKDSKYVEYKAKGSALMPDYLKIRNSHAALSILLDSLDTQAGYYMFSPEAGNMQMKTRDSLINAIRKKQREINGEIRKDELSYIKNHLNTDLSAYFLLRQPPDTFAVYYSQLPETVKSGPFANALDKGYLDYQKLKLYEQAQKTVVKGSPAPDFTLKNLAGDDFSLSSLKGKYVVLDFWGSWCGWCIAGYPRMKEYYAKYSSKVEFAGIACRDTEDKWRKAVRDNELNWLHVIDDASKDITRNVSTKYGIKGYPTKIILDKDLNIVEIFIGESDEFYNKLDELFKDAKQKKNI